MKVSATWPLWCAWCDRPIESGIDVGPLIVCNDCYEALDKLDRTLDKR